MDWIVKYWVEWLFGILATVLVLMFKNLSKRIREEHAKNEAIENAVRALLQSEMVDQYNHYSERGSAPLYARENFENCYRQYKALGGNGVMEDLHSKFFALTVE